MTVLLLFTLWAGDPLIWTTGQWDTFASTVDAVPEPFGHNVVSSRLRLTFEADLSRRWQWSASTELLTLFQDEISEIARPVFMRGDDFNRDIERTSDKHFTGQLDRFQLVYNGDRNRLRLGRQAIGFGNGRLLNPADLFMPIPTYALNANYKAGVDAARWTHTLNASLESEVFVIDTAEGGGIQLGTLHTTPRGFDITAGLGRDDDRTFMIWDAAGDLFGATFYNEGVWREEEAGGNTLRTALGASRRFGTKLDITLETSFNRTGAREESDFARPPGDTEPGHASPGSRDDFVLGKTILRGRAHSALALGYEIHPLVRGNLSYFQAWDATSHFALVNVDWDFSQVAMLRLGLYTSHGSLTSEFGPFSQGVFLEVQRTF